MEIRIPELILYQSVSYTRQYVEFIKTVVAARAE